MSKIKGETRFVSDGKTFELKFTFNALCELEDAFGMSINKFLEKMEADSKTLDFAFRDLRKMMRCGLSHADSEIDEQKAGEIIEGIGDMKAAFDIISNAMMDSFGSGENEPKNAERNPEQTL